MFAAKKQPTNSNSAKDIDKLRLAKEKKPKKSKEKNVRRVARSVQETIPYERVCTNYIFEVSKNHYSKTYSFSDVSYTAASPEEQERIFLAYGDLLNSFDTTDDIQITLHNNVINKKEFSNRILQRYIIYTKDLQKDEQTLFLAVYLTQFL